MMTCRERLIFLLFTVVLAVEGQRHTLRYEGDVNIGEEMQRNYRMRASIEVFRFPFRFFVKVLRTKPFNRKLEIYP